LLANGADLQAKGALRENSLHVAAAGGHTAIVATVIEKGIQGIFRGGKIMIF
jgi:hypothetical protein